MKEYREKEFNSLLKMKKSALILFGAPWCAACKLMVPIINKIAKDFRGKDFVFAEIDVSKNNGLASKMGVMSLPNMLFIKKGKITDQIIGAVSQKELEKKLSKF